LIGVVISAGKATLRELEEFYSTEDVYDLMEIIIVDATNREIAQEHYRQDNGNGR